MVSDTRALLVWFVGLVEGKQGSGPKGDKVLYNTGGICPSVSVYIGSGTLRPKCGSWSRMQVLEAKICIPKARMRVPKARILVSEVRI